MRDVSFILLAGGHSSRMGRDKAQLCWQGKTFLQHQAEKAQALGVGESASRDTGAGTAPGGWCRMSTRSGGLWAGCTPASRRRHIRCVWCSAWTCPW